MTNIGNISVFPFLLLKCIDMLICELTLLILKSPSSSMLNLFYIFPGVSSGVPQLPLECY